MHGHQWEPAEGTIVDVESGRHEHGGTHTYTIEAWNSRSVHVRGTVKHKSLAVYPVGSKVRIELDEHNQMRFDPNAPGGDPLVSTMSMSDQIAEASAAFDRPGSYGPDPFGDAGGTRGTVIVTGGETTVRFTGGMPEGLAGFVSASTGAAAPGGPAPAGGTAEERLAVLDQLLSRGMLTQSEYETQRQRIIESI